MTFNIVERTLQWRASRLPADLAERLLEEWLAEAAGMSRLDRLRFAVSVLLTRTATFVGADAGHDRPAEGATISVDDVLVPATEAPTLAAAFLVDLLWIAPTSLPWCLARAAWTAAAGSIWDRDDSTRGTMVVYVVPRVVAPRDQ